MILTDKERELIRQLLIESRVDAVRIYKHLAHCSFREAREFIYNLIYRLSKGE